MRVAHRRVSGGGVRPRSDPSEGLRIAQRDYAAPRSGPRIVRSRRATIRLATINRQQRRREAYEARLRRGGYALNFALMKVQSLAFAAVCSPLCSAVTARKRVRAAKRRIGVSFAAARRRVETNQCGVPRNGFSLANVQIGHGRCTIQSGECSGPASGIANSEASGSGSGFGRPGGRSRSPKSGTSAAMC